MLTEIYVSVFNLSSDYRFRKQLNAMKLRLRENKK